MTMRAGIFGLMIASAITAGIANADESDQKDSRWTGFYVGVNGGLARSDSKEAMAFGAPESSFSGSKNAASNTVSSNMPGYDVQESALGLGSKSEIGKALPFLTSK